MQLRSFVYSVLLSRAKEPVLVRAAAAIYWRSRMPHPLNPPLLPSPSFTPSNLRTATCVCDTQKTVILSGCCIYNVHCCLYFNTTASLLFLLLLTIYTNPAASSQKRKKKAVWLYSFVSSVFLFQYFHVCGPLWKFMGHGFHEKAQFFQRLGMHSGIQTCIL